MKCEVKFFSSIYSTTVKGLLFHFIRKILMSIKFSVEEFLMKEIRQKQFRGIYILDIE
jgi:hypothetical protein